MAASLEVLPGPLTPAGFAVSGCGGEAVLVVSAGDFGVLFPTVRVVVSVLLVSGFLAVSAAGATAPLPVMSGLLDPDPGRVVSLAVPVPVPALRLRTLDLSVGSVRSAPPRDCGPVRSGNAVLIAGFGSRLRVERGVVVSLVVGAVADFAGDRVVSKMSAIPLPAI